ncbi:MAG TPA: NTP transferase domain-containing protein [Nakamurella sp.]|nr:NTP transferase domain-containing protein [Nakamurella sp.]
MTQPVAAIVLAGGRGRRLGDVDKPELADRDGRTLLEGVLAAVADALVVVVGPPRDLPPGIISVREDPPGGGPAAAVAAGCLTLAESPGPAGRLPPDALVAVLAADLPHVTAGTVELLCAAVDAHPDAGGALLVDSAGRRQHLVGVWRQVALLSAVRQRRSWDGASLKELFAPIPVFESPALGDETADIDTPDDLRRWLGR